MTKEKSGTARRSNIELFRIFSMLIIVAHHYVVNSGLLDCIESQSHLGLKDYFLLLFGWGGKTGINCFVLITGYFMCTSSITKGKFFRLLREVYFYNMILWFLFFISGYEPFSTRTFLDMLFPFSTVADNFTACFLLFYLLIPFLNKLIHALTEKEHFKLLIWCLAVYVVLPSVAGATVVFNYVSWFSVLYIAASYIRLYPKSWFDNTKLTGLLAMTALIISWTSIIVLAYFSRAFSKPIMLAYFFVSDSNKILALATGLSAFLFFKNLDIGCSKLINAVASATFGVLQIHANSNAMRRWLWQDTLNNVGAYESGHVIFHAVSSVLLIYAICTIIDMCRICLSSFMNADKTSNRFQK